jgi:hypothetical protein
VGSEGVVVMPQKADLPIWVRPFEVIVVNNQTALIEVVEDALSIHTIKSRGGYSSLAEFFFAKFMRVCSHLC